MNNTIPFYQEQTLSYGNTAVSVAGYASQVSVYDFSPETNQLLTHDNNNCHASVQINKRSVRKRSASALEPPAQKKSPTEQLVYTVPCKAPTSGQTLKRAQTANISLAVLSACEHEEVEEYTSVKTWNNTVVFSEAIMDFAKSGASPHQENVEEYLLGRHPHLFAWITRLKNNEAEYELDQEEHIAILWLDLVTFNYLASTHITRENLFHWRDMSGCCLKYNVPDKHPLANAIYARAEQLSITTDLLHAQEYKGYNLRLHVPVKADWDKTTEFATFILDNEDLDLHETSHHEVCERLLEANADLYLWLYKLAELEKSSPHDKHEAILAMWQDITLVTYLGDEKDTPVSDQFFNWRKLPAPGGLSQVRIIEEKDQKETLSASHSITEEENRSLIVSFDRKTCGK